MLLILLFAILIEALLLWYLEMERRYFANALDLKTRQLLEANTRLDRLYPVSLVAFKDYPVLQALCKPVPYDWGDTTDEEDDH